MGKVIPFRRKEERKKEDFLPPPPEVLREQVFESETYGGGKILCPGVGRRILREVCVERRREILRRRAKGEEVVGGLVDCLDCPRFASSETAVTFRREPPADEVPGMVEEGGFDAVAHVGGAPLPEEVVRRLKESGVYYVDMEDFPFHAAHCAARLRNGVEKGFKILVVGGKREVLAVKKAFEET